MAILTNDKNIYLLNVSVFGCALVAKCNDITILDEPLLDKKGLSININLNYYLLNEKNTISISFRSIQPDQPLMDHNVFKVKIKLLNASATINKIIFEIDSDKLSKKEKESGLTYELNYTLPVELPFVLSLNDLVQISPNMLPRLFKFYKEIYEKIQNKFLERLIVDFKLRNLEYSVAYYNPTLEDQKNAALTDLILDADNVAEAIDFIKCKAKFEFNNKLVSLVDEKGMSPLQLYNEQKDIITYIDINVGILKLEDKFTIIR